MEEGQVEIWQKCSEHAVLFRIVRPLRRCLAELIISSMLCTQNEHLFIGMSAREWKRANSAKQEKIWPHWKKIMKRLVQRVLPKMKRQMRWTIIRQQYLWTNNRPALFIFNLHSSDRVLSIFIISIVYVGS